MKVIETYSLDPAIKQWVIDQAKELKRSKSFIVNEILIKAREDAQARINEDTLIAIGKKVRPTDW